VYSTKLGIDRIDVIIDKIKGRRLGLVTNHTGFNSDMTHLIDLAKRFGDIEVVFTPEHGLYGSAGAGEKVESYYDEEYGVRVFSLYGDTREPPVEELSKLDVVIYDMQDVGLRWYTYISTLYYVVKNSAKAGIPLIVLDRPNPLTGYYTEGPVLEPDFKSFVGISEIPVRYSLTPGELALYFSKVKGLGGEVEVVSLKGWTRRMWFDETELPWIPPSPNIPNIETALAYAGACLLEGTTLSEGRGTTSPFLQFGAPWIKPRRLAAALNDEKMPGVIFRPTKFTPFASKYREETVGGIYLHITDRGAFKPFVTFIRILKKIKEMYGERFSLLERDERYRIDYLAGTAGVRACIEDEKELEDLEEEWKRRREGFIQKAQKVLLYAGVLRV